MERFLKINVYISGSPCGNRFWGSVKYSSLFTLSMDVWEMEENNPVTELCITINLKTPYAI